jgi:Fibronectin type III domain
MTRRPPMLVPAVAFVAFLCAVPSGLSYGVVNVHPHPTLVAGSVPAARHPGSSLPVARSSIALLGPFNGHYFRNSTIAPSGTVTDSNWEDIDTARHVVFATSTNGDTLEAFWVSNGTMIGRVPAGNPLAGEFAGPVVLDNLTHTLFVAVTATARHGFILLFNETTLAPVGNLSLAGSPLPDYTPVLLAFDPASNQVFAANSTDGYLAVISGALNVVTKWIACPVLGCSAGALIAAPNLHELAFATFTNGIVLYDTSADNVITTLVIPGQTGFLSTALAYIPSTSTLIVANFSFTSGLFYRFDLTTNGFIGSFPGSPALTFSIAYDVADSALLVLNFSFSCPGVPTCTVGSYSALELVDAGTGVVLQHLQALGAFGATFTWSVIDPGLSTVVLTGSQSVPTTAVHLPTLTVTRQFAAYPTFSGPMVVDPSQGTYITLGYYPTQLQSVVETTGAVSWTTPTPSLSPPPGFAPAFAGDSPHASLAIDDQAGIVFVADGLSAQVATFNANTGSPGAVIPLPIGTNATALAVDSTHHLLYVAETNHQVQIFGSVAGSLDGTATAAPWFVGCSGTADPVNVVAYFANCGTPGNVTTVQATSFSTGTVFAVGSQPVNVLWDPRGELIVANYGTNNLTTIQLSSGARGSIPLGPGNPEFLAEDVSDGLLAVADATGPTIQMLNLTDGTPFNTAWTGNGTGGFAFDNTSGTFVVTSEVRGSSVVWGRVSVPSTPVGPFVAVSNNTLQVNWTAPAGGNGATTYNVTLTPSTGAPVRLVNFSGTLHRFTGLVDGLLYAVNVTAGNFVGTSPPAGPVDATPVGIPYPPASASATALGSSAVIVWGAPASTDGSPVVNYTLQYRVGATGAYTSVSEGTAEAATVPGLSPGTFYNFRVIAWNAVGASNASAVAAAATQTTSVGVPGGFAGSALLLYLGIAAIVVFAALAVVFIVRRRPKNPPGPPSTWNPPAPATEAPAPADEVTPPPG